MLKVHDKGTEEESMEIRLENNDKGRFQFGQREKKKTVEGKNDIS